MARSYKRDKLGRFSSAGGGASSGFKGSNSLSGGNPVASSSRSLGGRGMAPTQKAAIARSARYNPASPFYVTKKKTGKIKAKGSGDFSWTRD